MPDAGTLRDWTQIEGDHFDIIRTFSPIQPIVFLFGFLGDFLPVVVLLTTHESSRVAGATV